MTKTVEVVAAILIENHRMFAAERGYGKWKGWYELPGGKVEPGESKEEALIREMREELEVDVEIEKYVQTIEYEYPDFHLMLHCYLCGIVGGKLKLLEHKEAKWLSGEEITSVRWLPADELLFDTFKRLLQDKK
ncbi:MAG: (deoxy)nucleoside triphosphate pyrophosphohydrolase [Lachnospiraceae bacterium]|nr:(deoxy)nucleoside triphosphate pyrophosphohydrolase [Lachnospiraceae bacterium]